VQLIFKFIDHLFLETNKVLDITVELSTKKINEYAFVILSTLYGSMT